jgi:hypothetical protein
MNKEQQELVNEAYKNYRSKSKDIDLPENLYNKLIDDLNKDAMFPIDNPNRMLSQEEFIGRVITNPDFAKQWGVTIYTVVEDGNTRIGINYNDKTIESYE